MKKLWQKIYPDQVIPLFLTIIVFSFAIIIYAILIKALNCLLSGHENIEIAIYPASVLLGVTIYLKTAVDFAIYIGKLMRHFPGWKNRIPIEIGTALGNALGTMLVLILWELFRSLDILLAVMIAVSSLVLLRLAEDGFDHIIISQNKGFIYKIAVWLEKYLEKLNRFIAPFLEYLLPHGNEEEPEVSNKSGRNLWKLAFTVPFLLGADDFAGYVPLFTVTNVFSFGIGVFLGHMILNILLYINPKVTIKIVSNSIVEFIGSLFFIALAIWGFVEVFRILF